MSTEGYLLALAFFGICFAVPFCMGYFLGHTKGYTEAVERHFPEAKTVLALGKRKESGR